MMDTVQREPITIEKHGRPVAVIMSAREYKELKLERLRAKLAVGQSQLDNNGQTITLNSKEERHEFFEDIKKRGRERVEDRKINDLYISGAS